MAKVTVRKLVFEKKVYSLKINITLELKLFPILMNNVIYDIEWKWKMHINLIEELNAFNSFGLIRKLSALRLMPENADYHLRLDTLCHYCASIAPDPNKNEGNENELENLCNNLDSLGLEFLDYEYPSENLFTENIHFMGGGYNVLPGVSINGSFQLKLIIRGLNLLKLSHSESNFMHHIEEVILTILSLSDNMLKKAGITYGVFVSSDGDHKIKVPSKHNLQRLINSVTFTMAELLDTDISIDILNEFCFELGSINEKYVPDQTILNLKPLTNYQGNIIVSSPQLIISSLIHYIFSKAQEYNCLNRLASAINEVAELSSEMSMQKMGYILLKKLSTNYYFINEGIYNLDSDKVAITLTVTDPLEDYDTSQMFSKANGSPIATAIKNTINNTIDLFRQHPHPPDDIFFIIAIQNFGREISFLIEEEFQFPILVISLESLSVISTIEQDEVLRLYKYVISKENFKIKVDLVYFDELDLFFFYRSQGYQFRLPLDSEKAALFLRTNTGLPLKQEAFLHSRLHVVPSRYTNATIEVSSVYLNSLIPIFFCNVPKEVQNEYFGFAVEVTSSRWIWVVPKEKLNNEYEMKYYYLVIDMLTYWLWQVSSFLKDIEHVPYETINVEVSLKAIDEWGQSFIIYDEECHPPFYITGCFNNTISLTIEKTFMSLLSRADNLGEKKLMIYLLQGIADLFEQKGVLLDRRLLLDGLNQVMLPLEKKKIILTTPGLSELTPIGTLPPFRPVQPEDENILLMEISSYLSRRSVTSQNMTEREKSSLLNEIVGFLFRKLEKEIALIEPYELINTLVMYNDSAVKKRMTLDLSAPAFVACFPNEDYALKQIEKETRGLNQASVAIRFLIEYVAASSKKGDHKFTLELLDRLIAIASRIISLGQESDLIRYKLGKVDIIIDNGQFSTYANRFVDIYNNFHNSIIRENVHQRIKKFKYNWIDSEDEVAEDKSTVTLFDAGFTKELGLSYLEFGYLAGLLLEISIREEVPVICEPVGKLKLVAEEKYGVSQAVFDQFLALMSLSKRDSFINPGIPFENYDVWPWRFNRELSYLRRPIILQDDFIIFSYNHLYNSLYYFFNLFDNGTFKAKSLEMKQFISKYVNEMGNQFNQKVEQYIKSDCSLIVKSQVKKIGKHKISGEKGELGDIDVMVINPDKRIIWLVECKDLNRASTPFEIYHELCKLFVDSEKDSCIVTKHKRRADWFERNLQIVLSTNQIQIDNLGEWKVKPLIVISKSMISPYLFNSAIRVISFDKLVEIEF